MVYITSAELMALPARDLVVIVLLFQSIISHCVSSVPTLAREKVTRLVYLPVPAAVRLKYEAPAVGVLVEVAASPTDLVRRDLVVPPAFGVVTRAALVGEERRLAGALPVFVDAVADLDALALRVRDSGEAEEEQEEREHMYGAGISEVCGWS